MPAGRLVFPVDIPRCLLRSYPSPSPCRPVSRDGKEAAGAAGYLFGLIIRASRGGSSTILCIFRPVAADNTVINPWPVSTNRGTERNESQSAIILCIMASFQHPSKRAPTDASLPALWTVKWPYPSLKIGDTCVSATVLLTRPRRERISHIAARSKPSEPSASTSACPIPPARAVERSPSSHF